MPSIYVASLSDYNNGHLHGRWIDLDGKEVEDVREEIEEMLRGSRFPNVTVQCPDCDGEGRHPHSSTPRCETCKGQGVVPSAEEWAVHDYDELPNDYGEHPDLAELVQYAEMVDEHGDAWRAYVENVGTHYATADGFSDAYAGAAASELEWVENFLDDCGTLNEIPERLRSYFDFESYLRDLKVGGEVSFEELDGAVYAFWNY